jgi:ssDNA-binding Zn-finger/Zn-ribbon topoisomerase 1
MINNENKSQVQKTFTGVFACTEKAMSLKPTKLSSMELAKMPSLPCPECDSQLVLRNSKYGLFYGCKRYPVCKAAHGAHPNGKPLGKPADKETKQWRMKAHDKFNSLFEGENPLMSRDEAYDYLQYLMNLTAKQAHISNFDIAQCKELIDLLDFAN